MKYLFICQAPADVIYILELYEKYKNSGDVTIVVVNVIGLYEFFLDLKLSVNLKFVEYKLQSFYDLKQVVKEKVRLKKTFRLIDDDYYKVYFFSRFEDWITAYFIQLLKFKCNVYYVNHYDYRVDDFENKYSFKNGLIYFILLYITRISFRVNNYYKIPEYIISEEICEIRPAKCDFSRILSKYSFRLDNNLKGKNVLFFVSDYSNLIFNKTDYIEVHKVVLSFLLKCKVNVYIKEHPRIGGVKDLNNYKISKIRNEIPAELIDYNCFDFLIGVETTALANEASKNIIPCFSILPLFKINSKKNIEEYMSYLNSISKNNIHYIYILEDFKKIIDEK